MRIIQVLPTISRGDAVSNHALAIESALKRHRFITRIYAENIDGKLPKGTAYYVRNMPRLAPRDIVLYHGSTGSQLNYDLPKLRGKKAMIYHNITPPQYFERYSPRACELVKSGYEGMRFLADKIEYCMAVSSYNKEELRKLGYTCRIDVCPLIIPFEDYTREPNRKVIERYSNDGCTNLLFVGRIAPNKKHEEIIRAFYCYQRRYNAKSRLFLVGNSGGMEYYLADLQRYAQRLGIAESVVFPGHIGFDEVLAYYTLADAFVCMSEHEGFCVPLVESMLFDIPIVAYASSAIPETLGGSGLLLEDKDPEYVAAVVDRIVEDATLRSHVRATQRSRLEAFERAAVTKRFMECIQTIA